jgi:hypothetical protein
MNTTTHQGTTSQVKPDQFEQEASGWIRQELKHGEVDLERLEFNVIDTYRRLIRFPDRCPACTRNGLDHDMECPTDGWTGPDRSPVKPS